MKIKERILGEFQLTKKIESDLDIYAVNECTYLLFWDKLINSKSIESDLLNVVQEKTRNSNFCEERIVITIGKTNEKFKKSELLYYNGDDLHVLLYLIDEITSEIYMTDKDAWTLPFFASYKNIVRKIHSAVTK